MRNFLHRCAEWFLDLEPVGMIFIGIILFWGIVGAATWFGNVVYKIATIFNPKPKATRPLSEEELAFRTYGRIESGLEVFVFHIATRDCIEKRSDRFYSPKERDPLFYDQIKALNFKHAKALFEQKYPMP